MSLECLYNVDPLMFPVDHSCGFLNYEKQYNDLPSVEAAALEMNDIEDSDAFLEFMKAAYTIAASNGLDQDVGFRLIHNHFPVQDEQIMLELYDATLPAFISSAHELRMINSSSVAPSSWIFSNSGEVNFFEFTEDKGVHEIVAKIATTNFLAEIHNLIVQYNLQSLLALSVLSRSELSTEFGDVYLEKNYAASRQSIIQVVRHNETFGDIRTSWNLAGIIEHRCYEAEILYCESSDDGHVAVRRHTGL